MTIPVIDSETAAVDFVRRYCGWHVTPVIDSDVMVLDGRGGDTLILPTLRMDPDSLEIIENGVLLDLATVKISARGMVRKAQGCWWTTEFGGLQVTVTHGFETALDWWGAVKSYQARTDSLTMAGGPREAVGPFVFGATAPADDGSAFTAAEKAVFDLYRLAPRQ